MDHYAFGLAVNHYSCFFRQPTKGPDVVIADKKVYFNALSCEFAECLQERVVLLFALVVPEILAPKVEYISKQVDRTRIFCHAL